MANQPFTVQVKERIDEARGVIRLVFVDPEERDLPDWEPGAHIDVYVEGAGTDSYIKQYSLCGDPNDRKRYEIAVLRDEEGAGGSVAIHEKIRPGKLLRIAEPRNHFPLQKASSYVFVAGGIGITPLIPMIQQAQRQGADWTLHYAGRSLESMPFTQSLEGQGGEVHLYDKANKRRLSVSDILSLLDGTNAIYACGPTRLLDELEEKVSPHYVSDLHMERFTNDTIVNSEKDEPFDVELTISGKTVTVNPGESILDVVSRSGVRVPSSCLGGTCGTCETFVVSGEVDHRDAVLNAKEREESEVMMICVSRCKGKKLALEL